MPNYKVYTDNATFVKVGSTYAGRKVYGIAKCAPDDEFDYNFGYRLAKARCDMKVAEKRYKRAKAKFALASKLMKQAEDLYDDTSCYLADSWATYMTNLNDLNAIYDERSPKLY